MRLAVWYNKVAYVVKTEKLYCPLKTENVDTEQLGNRIERKSPEGAFT